MKPLIPATRRQPNGFTAVELIVVLTLAAVIMGAIVVGFGTLTRSQPRVASVVSVPLGTTRILNFYGESASSRDTLTAPHYGMMAQAEELREQFNTDMVSATAIYCLYRNDTNTYRPNFIAYNPVLHGELDTPQKFRAHLVTLGAVPATLYLDYRNPQNTPATTPADNVTIFVMAFGKVEKQMKVLSMYDIDVVRFTGTGQPQGFHASVKRFSDDPRGVTYPLALSGSYEVFYPPSKPNPASVSDWATDGFKPIFITFERATRLAIAEDTPIDRFKLAAERPFYFIWWPDPGARHLGPQATTLNAVDPRHAYNHMAGRTAFMFTVPMFPAL